MVNLLEVCQLNAKSYNADFLTKESASPISYRSNLLQCACNVLCHNVNMVEHLLAVLYPYKSAKKHKNNATPNCSRFQKACNMKDAQSKHVDDIIKLGTKEGFILIKDVAQ